MGHTALLVPVPELEPFVRARTEHYDSDWLSADPEFVHAHVTVLSPFVPRTSLDGSEVERIEAIVRRTAAFNFALAELRTFPNGVIYLHPEPDTAFRGLIGAVTAAFPEYPPYAGEFIDVVPHLTLDQVRAEVTEQSTRAAIAPLVPAFCRAERLRLAWYQTGGSRVLHDWPLTGS